jgi:hypothetical protein
MNGLVSSALGLIQRASGWLEISRMRRRAAGESGRWGAWRVLITKGALRLPPHAEFPLPAVVLLQVLGLVALSEALQGSTDFPPPISSSAQAQIPTPIPASIWARSPAVISGISASMPRLDAAEGAALDRLNEIAAMRPLLERIASDREDISPAGTESQDSAAAGPEITGTLAWWEKGLTPFHGLFEEARLAVSDTKAVPGGEKATDEGSVASNPSQESQADSRDAAAASSKQASGTASPTQGYSASVKTGQPAAGEQSSAAAASWLRAQGPGHFTLQLLSARRAATLRQFATSHKLPGPISIITSTRNGADLFGLVQGVYPSYPAAIAASKELMAQFGLEQPWVRTIDSVLTQMTGEEILSGPDLSQAAK